eukprot:TRINITY_DN49991_c0_g1_i1.p1 TRINITY_DN49991_c0_g1~~TRINITY_DN49991_c0_g1_i1.p1  ORF type:complete len:149 (-),score=16.40 TRINITY_DN49991_c0_g1_i1:80-526(-)
MTCLLEVLVGGAGACTLSFVDLYCAKSLSICNRATRTEVMDEKGRVQIAALTSLCGCGTSNLLRQVSPRHLLYLEADLRCTTNPRCVLFPTLPVKHLVCALVETPYLKRLRLELSGIADFGDQGAYALARSLPASLERLTRTIVRDSG